MDTYEKKYKEALERARELIAKWTGKNKDFYLKDYAYIFPELRESEDEKIRNKIIWLLQQDICPFPEEEVTQMLNYLEKQKEQDNEEGDFTIYHPQKNGEGKYECIPFSFYGSLTSFSNDKDLMDFLNESFYDKEECERWCEVENKPELPESKHKIKKDSVFDYLCESSGGGKQKEQKPVAWSEEDEDMLNSCISSIEEAKENRYAYKETDGDTSYDHEIAWLKSLRPQPKQEWSEENKKAWDALYKHFSVIYPGDGQFRDTKLSNRQITDFLKSLRPNKQD